MIANFGVPNEKFALKAGSDKISIEYAAKESFPWYVLPKVSSKLLRNREISIHSQNIKISYPIGRTGEQIILDLTLLNNRISLTFSFPSLQHKGHFFSAPRIRHFRTKATPF